MLSPVLVTPPATQPVTLTEAKAWAHVDHTDEDALITSLIKAATAHLDGFSGILGRALISQTWRFEGNFWGYPLRLPLAPVQSITSVAYWDGSNADQTFAAESYAPHSDAHGSYLVLNSGYSWPSVYPRADAVRVTAVLGYGDAAAVPEPLRHAILMMVAAMYGGASVDDASEFAKGFWGPFKRWSV